MIRGTTGIARSGVVFGDGRPLVLASASPRRLDLLRAVGVDPLVVVPPRGAELPWHGEPPAEHARAQALAKVRACAPRVAHGYVIAADTIVVRDQTVLGKPRHAAEAAAMLRSLSGRTHHVLTGLAVAEARGGAERVELEDTAVTFAELTDEEIARYVATGECFDKAGAYAIQGRAGVFVHRIEGCYFNVVGLPLPLLYRMLRG